MGVPENAPKSEFPLGVKVPVADRGEVEALVSVGKRVLVGPGVADGPGVSVWQARPTSTAKVMAIRKPAFRRDEGGQGCVICRHWNLKLFTEGLFAP
jgi:hypothetical protein